MWRKSKAFGSLGPQLSTTVLEGTSIKAQRARCTKLRRLVREVLFEPGETRESGQGSAADSYQDIVRPLYSLPTSAESSRGPARPRRRSVVLKGGASSMSCAMAIDMPFRNPILRFHISNSPPKEQPMSESKSNQPDVITIDVPPNPPDGIHPCTPPPPHPRPHPRSRDPCRRPLPRTLSCHAEPS